MDAEPYSATRQSLITRLKNWDDQESWREFFQTYWKLIYSVALKSGLTDSEAEDVVQETVLTVAKTMPGYRYEREKCRFKTRLMRLTRMRIVDQLRKRSPDFQRRGLRSESGTSTATIERIADSASTGLDLMWDEEWKKNLVDAAMERVKRRVKPRQYQIFYLSAVKDLGASQVARALGVSLPQVYLAKHRVASMVRKEARQLEEEMNHGATEPGHPKGGLEPR